MANTLAEQPADKGCSRASCWEPQSRSDVQREQERDKARAKATSAFYAGMKRCSKGTGFVLPDGLGGPQFLITDWVTGAPRARRATDNMIANMGRAKRRKYFRKLGIEIEDPGSSVEEGSAEEDGGEVKEGTGTGEKEK
ncbi:uncharacterized protein E0L32_001363 [Thyridium curvatum]|uniref:Uncharacterized protein n=1 Tax=Thyridium curvatum TaxID=1093900 RepID=A0A507ATY7_9PEZI|nr:uncharacterized protein E0L32_001363 [Thyridium curvatum]TPX10166.1 hypothetical protein E0L32_001363 [Thyridium curvatum]